MATSAFTSLRRSRFSRASRSSVPTADEYAATSKPASVQQAGESLRLGDREDVHDARPGKSIEGVSHPRRPLHTVEVRHDAEAQRRTGQRAAQRHRVRAELGGDVLGDPSVGGGGGGEHGRAGHQLEQRLGEALVVGAEVETPVGHAMRLIDDQQPASGEERRQLLGEARVGETFRRDQQNVGRPGAHLVQHVGPLLDVRRVDGRGAQSSTLGSSDLVAHQGQQRGDDDRVAATAGAQRARRRPVHRRLAPAGRLHDQDPRPVVDEGADGDSLIRTRHGAVAGHRRDRVPEMDVGRPVDHGSSVPNNTPVRACPAEERLASCK